MNPDIKSRWIAALRSGEYKQGRKRLRHAGRYCCLGVLCEIAKNEGVVDDYYKGPAGLPIPVREWGRLDDCDPFIAPHLSATEANDSGRYSFTDIANLIEEHL